MIGAWIVIGFDSITRIGLPVSWADISYRDWMKVNVECVSFTFEVVHEKWNNNAINHPYSAWFVHDEDHRQL